MNYFENNEESALLKNGIAIENGIDKVSIMGDLDFELSEEGLSLVVEMRSILAAIEGEMLKKKALGLLPLRIDILQPKSVKNPFEKGLANV